MRKFVITLSVTLGFFLLLGSGFAGPWQSGSTVDPMSDLETVWALTSSESGDEELIISCAPAHSPQQPLMIIVLTKDLVPQSRNSGPILTVDYRFPPHEMRTVNAYYDSLAQAAQITGGVRGFIDEALSGSGELYVRYKTALGSHQLAKFNVNGFSEYYAGMTDCH